jgi:hypothetical protein
MANREPNKTKKMANTEPNKNKKMTHFF